MKPKKFNPAFLPDDRLVDGFVVRHHQLDTIVSIIRDNTGAANQHLLMIAPRGFGKSTLLLRAAIAVRRDPELAREWFPLVFAEESYEVGSAGEFWLEAVRRLAFTTGETRWERAAEELRRDTDDSRLQARALGVLLDFADERGVRLLLVVENLDQLLGSQLDADAGWDLRKTLLSERRIMLLGSAVHRFDGLDQPDEPMFDLFRRVDMPALDARECDALWASVTGVRLGVRRAKAIRILCGGNPRLVVILAGFSQERAFGALLDELDDLIDDHTDYFRNNIEAITGQSRRVFLALAGLWKPSPSRVVAESARLPVNETSAALLRLVGQGRVHVARSQGKNHYYQLTERLYNIYYLMRQRGGPEARVRALVDFIRFLYEPGRRPDFLAEVAREACGRGEGGRVEHLGLLGHFLAEHRRDPPTLRAIIEGLPAEIVRAIDLPLRAKRELRQPTALAALVQRPDGASYLDAAIQRLRAFAKRSKAQGWNLAPPDEIVALAKAVGGHPAATLLHLLEASIVLFPTAEHAALVDICGRMLALDASLHFARASLAIALCALNRGEEAIPVLEKGLDLHPDNLDFAAQLGVLLVGQNQTDVRTRGIALLRRVAEARPGDDQVRDDLCRGMCITGRVGEAATICEAAIDRGPASAQLLRTTFQVAVRLESRAKGLGLMRTATTRNANSELAWRLQSDLEGLHGSHDAALESADRALTLGNEAGSWFARAAALEGLGRSGEADQAAQTAISSQPRVSAGWTLRLRLALRSAPTVAPALLEEALEATEAGVEALHEFASTLFLCGSSEVWPTALGILDRCPHDGCDLFARLVGAVRGSEAALAYVRSWVNVPDPQSIEMRRTLAMRFAAAGADEGAIEVASAPEVVHAMEPLIVALRLRRGEVVDAPVEVAEVASDVEQRIRALHATGDIWRVDPLALALPDEVDADSMT